jgi:hypothetical protein
MPPTEPEVSFPAASSGSRSSLFLAYSRRSNLRKAFSTGEGWPAGAPVERLCAPPW